MKAYPTFSIKNIIFSYCWQLSEFDYDNFSLVLIWLTVSAISLMILELNKNAKCAKTFISLEIAV